MKITQNCNINFIFKISDQPGSKLYLWHICQKDSGNINLKNVKTIVSIKESIYVRIQLSTTPTIAPVWYIDARKLLP